MTRKRLRDNRTSEYGEGQQTRDPEEKFALDGHVMDYQSALQNPQMGGIGLVWEKNS